MRFGEIKALSKLAKTFMKTAETTEQKAILAETEVKAGKAKKEASKKSAAEYVKTMTRILERGKSYVHGELERVAIMLKKGQMGPKQLKNFKRRVNILAVFANADETKKEEAQEGGDGEL